MLKKTIVLLLALLVASSWAQTPDDPVPDPPLEPTPAPTPEPVPPPVAPPWLCNMDANPATFANTQPSNFRGKVCLDAGDYTLPYWPLVESQINVSFIPREGQGPVKFRTAAPSFVFTLEGNMADHNQLPGNYRVNITFVNVIFYSAALQFQAKHATLRFVGCTFIDVYGPNVTFITPPSVPSMPSKQKHIFDLTTANLEIVNTTLQRVEASVLLQAKASSSALLHQVNMTNAVLALARTVDSTLTFDTTYISNVLQLSDATLPFIEIFRSKLIFTDAHFSSFAVSQLVFANLNSFLDAEDSTIRFQKSSVTTIKSHSPLLNLKHSSIDALSSRFDSNFALSVFSLDHTSMRISSFQCSNNILYTAGCFDLLSSGITSIGLNNTIIGNQLSVKPACGSAIRVRDKASFVNGSAIDVISNWGGVSTLCTVNVDCCEFFFELAVVNLQNNDINRNDLVIAPGPDLCYTQVIAPHPANMEQTLRTCSLPFNTPPYPPNPCLLKGNFSCDTQYGNRSSCNNPSYGTFECGCPAWFGYQCVFSDLTPLYGAPNGTDEPQGMFSCTEATPCSLDYLFGNVLSATIVWFPGNYTSGKLSHYFDDLKMRVLGDGALGPAIVDLKDEGHIWLFSKFLSIENMQFINVPAPFLQITNTLVLYNTSFIGGRNIYTDSTYGPNIVQVTSKDSSVLKTANITKLVVQDFNFHKPVPFLGVQTGDRAVGISEAIFSGNRNLSFVEVSSNLYDSAPEVTVSDSRLFDNIIHEGSLLWLENTRSSFWGFAVEQNEVSLGGSLVDVSGLRSQNSDRASLSELSIYNSIWARNSGATAILAENTNIKLAGWTCANNNAFNRTVCIDLNKCAGSISSSTFRDNTNPEQKANHCGTVVRMETSSLTVEHSVFSTRGQTSQVCFHHATCGPNQLVFSGTRFNTTTADSIGVYFVGIPEWPKCDNTIIASSTEFRGYSRNLASVASHLISEEITVSVESMELIRMNFTVQVGDHFGNALTDDDAARYLQDAFVCFDPKDFPFLVTNYTALVPTSDSSKAQFELVIDPSFVKFDHPTWTLSSKDSACQSIADTRVRPLVLPIRFEDASIPPPDNSATTAVAVLVPLAVVSIIAAAGVIFYFRRRHQRRTLRRLDLLQPLVTDEGVVMTGLMTQLLHAARIPVIDPSDIEFKDTIGVGATGVVVLGYWASRDTMVAVKQMSTATTMADNNWTETRKDQVRELIEEVQAAAQLNHPNVLPLLGCLVVTESDVRMLTPYMPNKTLASHISKLDEKYIVNIIRQIAWACEYLHSKDMVHRDLKPENILLDRNFKVAVSDFGKMKTLAGHSTFEAAGTAAYMAPEVIKAGEVSKAGDVYSFGVILVELATKERAFSGMRPIAIMHKIVNEGEIPKLPDRFSNPDTRPAWVTQPLIDLIRRCLAPKANDRPSFKEICDTLKTIRK